MAEQDLSSEELPLESAGRRLRNAREAAGLSYDDIAARTKIAKRHLSSIEEDRFGDLVSRTYAVGFSRAYARVVGLDEGAIAEAVRRQLAEDADSWSAPQRETFEPGDPARVPPARLAWIAALGALVVLALLFVFWRSFLSPAGTIPDVTEDPAEKQAIADRRAPPVRGKQPASGGPVVFTALESGIWVKFYDAVGNQLFQKQMDEGETYTVPPDAEGPQIWTARPDVLQITVGGREVPRLADEPVTIKDRSVSAASLLARRGSGSVAPRP